jgi:oxygen-independent coproporphyrinogen-3 oxidase
MIPAKFIWKPLVQKMVTGQWRRFHMRTDIPPYPENLKSAGLYLHVPFCKNLCPFCPYNRFKYDEKLFNLYEHAVRQEIDIYAPHLKDIKFTSLYVGGGTPTVNLE